MNEERAISNRSLLFCLFSSFSFLVFLFFVFCFLLFAFFFTQFLYFEIEEFGIWNLEFEFCFAEFENLQRFD